MKTCKDYLHYNVCRDCLHCEVCKDWWSEQEENLFSESNIACRVFTDRSEWVHLPCIEGTRVYWVENDANACYDCDGYDVYNECCEYKNIDFPLIAKLPVCNKHRLEIVTGDADKDFILCHMNDFGKTIFLTYEEAEKALERMKESD